MHENISSKIYTRIYEYTNMTEFLPCPAALDSTQKEQSKGTYVFLLNRQLTSFMFIAQLVKPA